MDGPAAGAGHPSGDDGKGPATGASIVAKEGARTAGAGEHGSEQDSERDSGLAARR
jgi:hypothetical protein